MTAQTPGRSTAAGWFTSSYSNQGNACVQVRRLGGHVQVADSKDRGRGPVITVTAADWAAFLAGAADGEFDGPGVA